MSEIIENFVEFYKVELKKDITYYNENQKLLSVPVKSLFEHKDIEEKIKLLDCIRDYLIDHGSNLLDDVYINLNKALQRDCVDVQAIKVLISNYEKVLKAIGYVVYDDITLQYDYKDQKINMSCYKGDKVYKGICNSMCYNLLSSSLELNQPNKFVSAPSLSLPAVNGRKGIINSANPIVYSIATNTRKSRNATLHSGGTSSEPIDSMDSHPAPEYEVDRGNAFIIFQRFILSMLFAIDYHFDLLNTKLEKYRNKGISQTDANYQVMAENYICEDYLNNLIKIHTDNIHNIYGMSTTEENQKLLDCIIPLKLIYIDNNTEELLFDDDENNDDIDYDPKIQSDPLEIIRNNQKCIILGHPGAGKSTILSQIILKYSHEWQANIHYENAMLPLRFNLEEYNDPTKDIFNYFKEYVLKIIAYSRPILNVKLQEALFEYLQKLIQQGRVLILLDGINEIPSKIMIETLNTLSKYISCGEQCKYILTGRVHEFNVEQIKKIFATYNKYYVCELSDRQIKDHLKRVCQINGKTSHDAQLLWETIEKDSNNNNGSNLKYLSTNPMHLMMIINILQNNLKIDLTNLNKGRLFKKFVGEILEKTYLSSQNQTEGNESSDEYAKKYTQILILHRLAWQIFLNNKSNEEYDETSLDMFTFIAKLSNEDNIKVYIQNNLNNIHLIIEELTKVRLLEKNDTKIKFTHDSFMEYFCADYFKTRYNQDQTEIKILKEIDLEKDSNFEFVKMTIELLDTSDKEKKSCINFMNDILKSGHCTTNTPMTIVQAQDGNLQFQQPELLSINKYLPLMAEAVTGIRNNDQKAIELPSGKVKQWIQSNVNLYIESYILNILTIYEKIYPNGKVELEYLIPVFKCAALTGSRKVFHRLFTPYWLQLWFLETEDVRKLLNLESLVNYDEVKKKNIPDSEKGASKLNKSTLSYVLLHDCKDYEYLFYEILDTLNILNLLMLWESKNSLLSLLLRMFHMMSKYEIRMLYSKIMADHNDKQSLAYLYAHMMLFFLDDPEFMVNNFDKSLEIKIGISQLNSLLRNHTNEHLIRFLFEPEIINKMTDNARQRLIRHYLFRDLLPKELKDYIFKVEELRRLGDEKFPIFDTMSIEDIPDYIVTSYYDTDVFRCQRQYIQNENTIHNGIGYRLYAFDQECLYLSIDDINYNFLDLKLRFTDDEKENIYSIEEDFYQTGYKCTVKCSVLSEDTESPLIPIYGQIKGEKDGERVTLSFIGAASNIKGLLLYTYNQEEQKLFEYWKNTDAIVTIDQLRCKVTHLSTEHNPAELRLLRLKREKYIPKYHSEILLFENTDLTQPIIPDKSICTEYTKRDKYFRPVIVESKQSAQHTANEKPYFTNKILSIRDNILQISINKNFWLKPGTPLKIDIPAITGIVLNIKKDLSQGRSIELEGFYKKNLPLSGIITCYFGKTQHLKVEYAFLYYGDANRGQIFVHIFNPQTLCQLIQKEKALKGCKCVINQTEGIFTNISTYILRREQVMNLKIDSGLKNKLFKDKCKISYLKSQDNQKEKLQDLSYTLFGFDDKNVMFIIEKIKTPLKETFCKISDSDLSFFISKKQNSQSQFAELTFQGAVQIDIPLSDVVYEQGYENEPLFNYVYSFNKINKYTLRVVDPVFIENLKDVSFRQKLIINQRYKIRNLSLKLESIQLIDHNPATDLITAYSLKELKNYSEIPVAGGLQFSINKDFHPLLPILSTKSLCSKVNVLNVLFAGFREERIIFLNQSQTVNSGLYIRTNNINKRMKISCQDDIYSVFSIELRIPHPIPEYGKIIFNKIPDYSFFYTLESQKENSLQIIIYSLAVSSLEIGTLQTNIAESNTALINEENTEDISIVAIKKQNDLSHRIVAQWGEADKSPWQGIRYCNLFLEYYFPIINEFPSEQFNNEIIDRNIFFINKLRYTKLSKNTILVRKSLSNLNSLYAQTDRNEKIYKIQVVDLSQTTTPELLDSSLIGLAIGEATDHPSLQKNGTIRFFRDSEGLEKAEIGFELIRNLIDYTQPDRYHSSICDILKEEFDKVENYDRSFFELFVKKSRSYMLLSLPGKLRKELKIQFNICSVVSYSPSQIVLYSSQDKQTYQSSDCSRKIEPHTFVILERNLSIHPIRLEEILPYRKYMGFKRGVIMTLDNNDAFIHILKSLNEQEDLPAETRKDYYFPFKDSEYKPNIGDIVDFYPSVNHRLSSHLDPFAEEVIFCKSGLRRGIIQKKERRYSEKDHAYLFSFVICDMKKTTEDRYSTAAIWENNEFWEAARQLEEGSECHFFNITIPVQGVDAEARIYFSPINENN